MTGRVGRLSRRRLLGSVGGLAARVVLPLGGAPLALVQSGQAWADQDDAMTGPIEPPEYHVIGSGKALPPFGPDDPAFLDYHDGRPPLMFGVPPGTPRAVVEELREIHWQVRETRGDLRLARNGTTMTALPSSRTEEDAMPLDRDTSIPPVLSRLAAEISNSSYERAKRKVVSKVGSVGRYDRFDDDVADAVFLRIQRNCQVGRYSDEGDLMRSRPGARRLEGEGTITLYRASPRGTTLRPGDFATDSRNEAGYYLHGGHVIHETSVPRRDVVAVPGAMGDGQEYVLLPRGYVPPVPEVWFEDFGSFWAAARGFAPEARSPAAASLPESEAPSPGTRR